MTQPIGSESHGPLRGRGFRAIRLGRRTLLAASCRKCGKLLPGKDFAYRVRNHRDKYAYIDQRCPNCKWGASVKGKRHVA